MNNLYVTYESGLINKAQAIADELGANLLSKPLDKKEQGFTLHISQSGLSLKQNNTNFKPLVIDPGSAQFLWRQKTFGKQQPLARAIGIKKDYLPNVLDATAGLGRDALLIASLGCKITLLERNKVLALMLKDALALPVHHADAVDWLPTQTEKFDVIYIDPMFPENKKSALVKKDMQLLQKMIGEKNDNDKLLATSMKFATKRVVVKRPLHAAPLENRKPSFEIKTKTIRFDVYLREPVSIGLN
jgi:16S rRNA (guanine1516-N2)-methyltransferase